MGSKAQSQQRRESRDELVASWGKEHEVDIGRLDDGQKWLVFVALQLLAWIGDIVVLKRFLGCLLSHCGMGLSSTQISKLVGGTDRNVRYNREHSAEELWKRLSRPERGHRAAKLRAEHAGPVAKFLVNHQGARVDEILAFIDEELGAKIKPLTLRRFIKRYGLGVLREDVHDDSPLFWAPAAMAAPFS